MKVIKFKQFVNEAVAMPAAPVIPVVAAGNTPARDAVVNDCLATIYITMYKAMSTFVAEAKKEKFNSFLKQVVQYNRFRLRSAACLALVHLMNLVLLTKKCKNTKNKKYSNEVNKII